MLHIAAQLATQEAAAEQAAIEEALGKKEAATVVAAASEPAKKPLGFFDKLMKLVSVVLFLYAPLAGSSQPYQINVVGCG